MGDKLRLNHVLCHEIYAGGWKYRVVGRNARLGGFGVCQTAFCSKG